jgi:hypothetical protein
MQQQLTSPSTTIKRITRRSGAAAASTGTRHNFETDRNGHNCVESPCYDRDDRAGIRNAPPRANGLEWSTLSKMRNIMSLIYAHAQRKSLIPEDVKYNPVRPP